MLVLTSMIGVFAGAGGLMIWLSPLGFGMDATLAAANLTICSIGIVRSFYLGLRPVSLVFFVFSFGWLAFAPIQQLSTGQLAWGDSIDNHSSDAITTALLLNGVASAVFLVAHLLGGLGSGFRKTTGVSVSGSFLVGLALVASVAGFVGVLRLGGVGVLFSSRGERWDSLTGPSGVAVGGIDDAITRVLPAALAMAFGVLSSGWIRQTWRGWRRLTLAQLGVGLVAAGLLFLFANPFSSSRFIVAAAWGSVFLSALRPRTARSGLVGAVGGLIAILVLYPYGNVFRSGAGSENTVRAGLDAFVGPDFDGFQQVVNTLEYVETHGHTFGKYIISAAGYFVPRSLWESKALPASIDIAGDAGYWFTNLSLPLHAELFLEFGWFGAILGVGALGYLGGRCDREWLAGDSSRLSLIAPVVALSILGVMRGPLGSLVPIYATALLVLLAGLRRRPAGEAGNVEIPGEAWQESSDLRGT